MKATRFGFINRLRIELRLALGSVVGGFAFVALAAASAVALWVGFEKVDAQREAIERSREAQATETGRQAETMTEPQDAGSIAYSRFHVVADPPGPWAFVALGVRDGAVPLQRIRMLGLEAQIHDGELVHPELASAGSFDFAFVVIFLLPLALVATLHDLRSGEAEAGRLSFLTAVVADSRKFWLYRACVRFLLALAATAGPLCLGAVVVGAPLGPLPGLVLTLAAYGATWTLVAMVIALRPAARSVGSAVVLLSLWCFSVLVLPGLAGVHAMNAHPTDLGAEITLAQRAAVNDAWDLPKEATFREFFRHYPEWNDTPPVTERFHWKWYFAFHEVGDRSVAGQVEAYGAAIEGRERVVKGWSFIVPALAVQRLFTAVAETDEARRRAHIASVRRFHAALRTHFYPWIFNEQTVSKSDYASLPTFESAAQEPRRELIAAAGLALLTILGSGITALRLRQGERG